MTEKVKAQAYLVLQAKRAQYGPKESDGGPYRHVTGVCSRS